MVRTTTVRSTMTNTALASSMAASDLEELRTRYRAERDRRIRPDGLRQYQGTRGAFGYWATDPYTPRADRPAKTDRVEVLVVGGGFGGLLTGARLRQAGFTDIRMTEEGGDFGGTWYWNRYPGIHCDIEASVYMPLLEEVGTVPTRRYAPGEEIRQHAVAIGRHFALYDDVLFHTRITEAPMGRRRSRVGRPDGPRRRDAGAVRDRVLGVAVPAEAPGDPWHRDLHGAHVPHQSVGLRLHRW